MVEDDVIMILPPLGLPNEAVIFKASVIAILIPPIAFSNRVSKITSDDAAGGVAV